MKKSLFICFCSLIVINCFAIVKTEEWSISRKGDKIQINADILKYNLILANNGSIASEILVNGVNLTTPLNDELNVTFWKASPNEMPQGILYSDDAGVEQTDAVKNQTDALSVEQKVNKSLQKVCWTDSVNVSKTTFSKFFKNTSCEITEPNAGTKKLTLVFLANEKLKGISLEINYEIYEGYPVVRKWVKFSNSGSDWLKIDRLILEQFKFNKKYKHTTLLTPGTRGINPSIVAFSDSIASIGIISASEIPSKLRRLTTDGIIGYNPVFFEWVLGPGDSFESEPVFIYSFSGKCYRTVSAVSTALDRCIEGEFQSYLNRYILRPINSSLEIAPVFCSWTNYSANINDNNMHVATDIASRIGFKTFQLDAGWSDTGPNGGWAVSMPKPNLQNFTKLNKLSDYIRSKSMVTGLWYSVFMNELLTDKSQTEPVLFSLPLIRRAGGLGMSFCFSTSRQNYINDLVFLNKIYQARYFKQDLSNLCYGDIAYGHEGRTLKESYLRGLRGLFQIQDEIHRQAPDVWLQLSHEIYWETPGPEADIAVFKHVDSYHAAPNEYWGAGNRSKLVTTDWKFNVDSLKEKLIQGAFRARELLFAHRGLPLDRVEVFAAVSTNFNGSLTPEIQDRQICSWLLGAPISFSGDLTSLTDENIKRYQSRFAMSDRLQRKYNIYPHFQFSGVPAPTDKGWHWFGKLDSEGRGAVVVLRGSEGSDTQKINIPWVKADRKYNIHLSFENKNLGFFSGKELQKGDLSIDLKKFGQEIIEIE